MAYNITPSLKSEGLGTLLVWALYLGLAIASFSLLCSLILLLNPDFYRSIEVIDRLTWLMQIPMIILAAILFLVWMYVLHGDLKSLFRTYAISPGQALASLAIPIYNLWGIWNVFATIADRLKSHGGKLAEGGATLRFWLPLLYIVTLAARILNRMSTLQEGQAEQSNVSTIMLVNLGLEVFLWFIWLEMAKVVQQAVKYRFKDVQQNLAQAAGNA